MKMNYLFRSQNNGHFSTYQTIISDTVLTQEKVTEWLSAIPGVGRMGADINQFCEILDKKGINWSIFRCPCCDALVKNIMPENVDAFITKCNLFGFSWVILEGISGNY
jgi:hypothetical protein